MQEPTKVPRPFFCSQRLKSVKLCHPSSRISSSPDDTWSVDANLSRRMPFKEFHFLGNLFTWQLSDAHCWLVTRETQKFMTIEVWDALESQNSKNKSRRLVLVSLLWSLLGKCEERVRHTWNAAETRSNYFGFLGWGGCKLGYRIQRLDFETQGRGFWSGPLMHWRHTLSERRSEGARSWIPLGGKEMNSYAKYRKLPGKMLFGV